MVARAPNCDAVIPGSNPVPPQPTANSVSPRVGCHRGDVTVPCVGLWRAQSHNSHQKSSKYPSKKKFSGFGFSILLLTYGWNSGTPQDFFQVYRYRCMYRIMYVQMLGEPGPGDAGGAVHGGRGDMWGCRFYKVGTLSYLESISWMKDTYLIDMEPVLPTCGTK